MDSANRLTSLVNNIEEEMQKSGVNVSFTKFANLLNQLQENGPELHEKLEVEGDYVDVPLEPKLFQSILGAQQRIGARFLKLKLLQKP